MIPTLEGTIHTEGESEDFYNDQIRKHVIGERRTAFVTGPPGTGTREVLRKNRRRAARPRRNCKDHLAHARSCKEC